MKLHFYFVLVLSFFLFTSCNNDDDDNPTPTEEILLQEYLSHYMFADNNNSMKLAIDYQNQKPIKRRTITDSPGNPIGGVGTFGNFYDELTYNGNSVIIIKKNVDYPNEESDKSMLIYNNNQIVEKYYFGDSNIAITKHVYHYTNDKITRIQNYMTDYNGGIYLNSQSEISYNGNNLNQITTRHAKYDSATNSYILNTNDLEKEVETFSGFDNYQNPTKKLKMFDGLFLRSLSENNFTQYKKIKFDENGNQTPFIEQKNWTFVYENGQINFAK